MSTVSDHLPTSSSSQAPIALPDPSSDPENQHEISGKPVLPPHRASSRVRDFLLSPFNMWAPLPDYDLAQRLNNHRDERIHNGLYKVLIGAQNLRTHQWRIAYWMMSLSLLCTLGTALIGITTAVLSFSDNPVASKALSITLAGFGVILSLLKGSGLPASAFMNINKANGIIDSIEDFISGDTLDPKRIDEIKTAWREVRDNSMAEQASVWKNMQK